MNDANQVTKNKAKILIAYAGKTGTTAICAEMLKKALLPLDADLHDLVEQGVPTDVELESYSAVVVGSCVRFGALQKSARELYARLDALDKKGAEILLGGYVTCCYADRMREYVVKIPECVKEGELGVSCFGGEMNLDRARGFDKFFIRVVRDKILHGGDNGDGIPGVNLPTVHDVDINQFAARLARLLGGNH